MSSSLSSEQSVQLVPLLGSLARLIAGGSPLNESSLHTLLLGADLEDNPAALAELQRWGRLLKAVQQDPTVEQREATVEALFLRGLPEAPVLLAIATVAGSVPASVTTSPAVSVSARLQASVANLDFGTLRSGQGAVLELNVQGGPGQVRVESDQLQVTPPQFGAEPTRLRVMVRPLASGLLWTSLKLVTVGETLEVPVTAQWQATAASSPPVQPAVIPVAHPPPPVVVAPPMPHQPAPVVVPPSKPQPSASVPPNIVQSTRARRSYGWIWLLVLLVVGGLGGSLLLNRGVSSRFNNGEQTPAVMSTIAPTAMPTDESGISNGIFLPVQVPEMVKVPAGSFLMGSSSADPQSNSSEKPQHRLTLPTYEIGKTEVTNAQFLPFVKGDGYTNRAYWDDTSWHWRTEQQRTQPSSWDNPDRNGEN